MMTKSKHSFQDQVTHASHFRNQVIWFNRLIRAENHAQSESQNRNPAHRLSRPQGNCRHHHQLPLERYDINILNADQHQDVELGLFFMRVEFVTEAASFTEAAFRAAFAPIARDNKVMVEAAQLALLAKHKIRANPALAASLIANKTTRIGRISTSP